MKHARRPLITHQGGKNTKQQEHAERELFLQIKVVWIYTTIFTQPTVKSFYGPQIDLY